MFNKVNTFFTAKFFSFLVAVTPVLRWFLEQADHSSWVCGLEFFLHLLHFWFPQVFWASFLFSLFHLALKLLSKYGWLEKK